MSDGPPGEYLPRLNAFVRVVRLPGDPINVHLVVEIVRAGRPSTPADYMAPTTVCRAERFADTKRTRSACPECERGMPEAIRAAKLACRNALNINDAVAATN